MQVSLVYLSKGSKGPEESWWVFWLHDAKRKRNDILVPIQNIGMGKRKFNSIRAS